MSCDTTKSLFVDDYIYIYILPDFKTVNRIPGFYLGSKLEVSPLLFGWAEKFQLYLEHHNNYDKNNEIHLKP